LVAEAVLIASCLASLNACADAEAISTKAGRLEQVRVGFGLDTAGRVSPGCAAKSFAVRDPIHLSMYVNDAATGEIVSVSVRDVVSQRVVWSERRPVPPGASYQTFAIGREISQGRYRAESTLGGDSNDRSEFVVHDRRPGVR